MGVPFEALLPYGIMLGVRSSPLCKHERITDPLGQLFAFTGAGLSKVRHMQNGGKRARHSVDQWDRVRHEAVPLYESSWLTIEKQSMNFSRRASCSRSDWTQLNDVYSDGPR